jgi:hypothetical protein
MIHLFVYNFEQKKHMTKNNYLSLLFQDIAKVLGIDVKLIDLITINGRPIINMGFISIAHSYQCVVCAFSKNTPIGLDVEFIQSLAKAKKYNSVKKDFKSLHYWTIYESWQKLYGATFLYDIFFNANYAPKFFTKINSFFSMGLTPSNHIFYSTILNNYIITICSDRVSEISMIKHNVV